MKKFIKLICKGNSVIVLSKNHIVAIYTGKDMFEEKRIAIVLSTGDVHEISTDHHTLESILNQIEDE